jgi:hypothetical protein
MFTPACVGPELGAEAKETVEQLAFSAAKLFPWVPNDS